MEGHNDTPGLIHGNKACRVSAREFKMARVGAMAGCAGSNVRSRWDVQEGQEETPLFAAEDSGGDAGTPGYYFLCSCGWCWGGWGGMGVHVR